MTTLEEPLSVKMARWTQIALERPLTTEENREMIRALRGGRTLSASAPKASRSKAPVDVAGMEDELDNL